MPLHPSSTGQIRQRFPDLMMEEEHTLVTALIFCFVFMFVILILVRLNDEGGLN
jgi:hypothetical protein